MDAWWPWCRTLRSRTQLWLLHRKFQPRLAQTSIHACFRDRGWWNRIRCLRPTPGITAPLDRWRGRHPRSGNRLPLAGHPLHQRERWKDLHPTPEGPRLGRPSPYQRSRSRKRHHGPSSSRPKPHDHQNRFQTKDQIWILVQRLLYCL